MINTLQVEELRNEIVQLKDEIVNRMTNLKDLMRDENADKEWIHNEKKNINEDIQKLENKTQKMEDETKKLVDKTKKLEDETKKLEDETKELIYETKELEYETKELKKETKGLKDETTKILIKLNKHIEHLGGLIGDKAKNDISYEMVLIDDEITKVKDVLKELNEVNRQNKTEGMVTDRDTHIQNVWEQRVLYDTKKKTKEAIVLTKELKESLIKDILELKLWLKNY